MKYLPTAFCAWQLFSVYNEEFPLNAWVWLCVLGSGFASYWRHVCQTWWEGLEPLTRQVETKHNLEIAYRWELTNESDRHMWRLTHRRTGGSLWMLQTCKKDFISSSCLQLQGCRAVDNSTHTLVHVHTLLIFTYFTIHNKAELFIPCEWASSYSCHWEIWSNLNFFL